MKFLCLIFLMAGFSFAQTQKESTIQRDLRLLRGGGAGNGGGSLALNITASINSIALQQRIRDLGQFRSSYTTLVGGYQFCGDDVENCQISIKFYPSHKAVLVDKKGWNQLEGEEQTAKLEEIVREIDEAR